MQLNNRMNHTFASATSGTEAHAPRSAAVERNTAEVSVSVKVRLDGTGKAANSTGLPFLDHMLDVRALLPFL